MKKLFSIVLTLATLNLMFVSCERTSKDAPDLPPYESMVIDFSQFTDGKTAPEDLATKSADATAVNFTVAAFDVAVFNIILTATLVVPVAAFGTALNQQPTFIGESTWEWQFTVNGFGGAYTARLTGEVLDEDVEWKMYVAKTGIGAFNEFMWYEGTSRLDGTGGYWLLNHSAQFPEPMLQIDWSKEGDAIDNIKYTIVRELTDNRSTNAGYGSYIEAGHTEDVDFDSFYNIYLAETDNDVYIQWSSIDFSGRIMDEGNALLSPGWNCWDSNGYDVVCAE